MKLTGAEIIEKMLRTECKIVIDNGSIPHYKPFSKTISMPEKYLGGTSLTSAAVAAHEAAHAIQHASGSLVMYLRMILSALFFLYHQYAMFACGLIYLITGSQDVLYFLCSIIVLYYIHRATTYYLEQDANEIALAWLAHHYTEEEMSVIDGIYQESLKANSIFNDRLQKQP